MKNVKLAILLAAVAAFVGGKESSAATINDVNFLTGSWVGTYHGMPMEALYTNGNGGMILGVTKVASPEATDFFEFEQIAQEGESLVLRPFPFAKEGVPFTLKEISAQRVVFKNPANDFPSRIIYEVNSSGELLARIEGTHNGQPITDELLFTKAK